LSSCIGREKQKYIQRPSEIIGGKYRFDFDITNILRAAFTQADPKSAKNTVRLSVLFALLGSVPLKASHKMLMKLTPGCNVIN